MSDRLIAVVTHCGRLGAGIAMVWIVSGCQSTTRVGDRYYENGKYPEAAAAFQAYLDSNPTDKEQRMRTLYRLGVIWATPGNAAYEPQRSLDVLQSLLTQYPGSAYSGEAALLRNLQLKIRDLDDELTAERVRLAELEVDLAEREGELASLDRELVEKADQIQTLQESIPPLRVEIRGLIRELASKEDELEQLERLKAIDLEQPPP